MSEYGGKDRRHLDDTRDIAITADSKIDQHMTDCTSFRSAVQDTLNEFREDIKKLNWRMACLLGGLELMAKTLDFLIPVLHRINIQ